MRELTEEEHEVLALLGEAFNRFNELPELHISDKPEFIRAMHAAQNIVMARPTLENQIPRVSNEVE